MTTSNQEGTHLDTPMHAIVKLEALIIQEDKNGAFQQCDYISELSETVRTISVSYTHLDVYKRQVLGRFVELLGEIMTNSQVPTLVQEKAKEIQSKLIH